MEPARDLTTEADIDAALERAKNAPAIPRAVTAQYSQDLDLLILQLDNHRRLAIPREQLQGLESATPSQLAQIEIFGGLDIAWPQLDVDHYLPYLLEGSYGSDRWMRDLQEKWNLSLRRDTIAA